MTALHHDGSHHPRASLGAIVPSRRRLMSGCIASVATAVGPLRPASARPASAGSDDMLVAEAAGYFAAYLASETHPATRMVIPPPALIADQEATIDRIWAHAEQVANLPAHGLSRLQAKARVLMREIDERKWTRPDGTMMPPLEPPSDIDVQKSLAWSLCADLLRMEVGS